MSLENFKCDSSLLRHFSLDQRDGLTYWLTYWPSDNFKQSFLWCDTIGSKDKTKSVLIMSCLSPRILLSAVLHYFWEKVPSSPYNPSPVPVLLLGNQWFYASWSVDVVMCVCSFPVQEKRADSSLLPQNQHLGSWPDSNPSISAGCQTDNISATTCSCRFKGSSHIH